MSSTVGIVSPGYMGGALAQVLMARGVRVVTTLAGRGERSRRLAAEAGLLVLDELADVVAASDVVLSVVPPGSAHAVAVGIAEAANATGGTPPVFAELNAVSPTTLLGIQQVIESAGMDFVDGSISGHPPTVRPGTRIHLCGPARDVVAALPWDPDVAICDMGHSVGRASALKMCSASVYKGLQALEIVAMLTARRLGILDEVIEELGHGVPRNATKDVLGNVVMAATKSDRFTTEMGEVARTHGDAGFGGELFDAVEGIYAAVADGLLAREKPEDVAQMTSEAASLVDRLLPPKPVTVQP